MGMIYVEVWDATGNKRRPAEVPDDAPVNRIIDVLVDRLQLPRTGPDGQPIVYKFHHKNSGRQLHDHETLAASGVQSGDILRLQPEITAGGDGMTPLTVRHHGVRCAAGSLEPARALLAEDVSREHGGFLLGRVVSDGDWAWTEVHVSVPCPEAPGSLDALTLTPDCWQLAHEHPDVRLDRLGIVGWFHSHPGMPLSMSSRDRWIQRSFFAAPHQAAWIRDPIGDRDAWWRWSVDGPVAFDRVDLPEPNLGSMAETGGGSGQ